MEWLMDIGKEYGLFAMLVAYVIWDSRQREHKYLAIIKTLSDKVSVRLTKIESKMGIKWKDEE
jgi:Flp pilus assembly pilin Flp